MTTDFGEELIDDRIIFLRQFNGKMVTTS